VVDFEALRDLYAVRRAAAESNVVEWRWSATDAHLASRLVPVWDERHGDRPRPPKFLKRAPKRVIAQSAFGFADDGRVVVERSHGYDRVLAEEFVAYSDDEVEAVRYGHWVEGNPDAGNIAIVAEWTWRLVYDAGRAVRYESSSRDGGRTSEEFGYGVDGTLATVVGSSDSRFGQETWSWRVREAAGGGVVEVTDEHGNRIYG